MSGIELDETCINLFMHMKTRSSVSSGMQQDQRCAAGYNVSASRAESLLRRSQPLLSLAVSRPILH
jgi:hypothetical protein